MQIKPTSSDEKRRTKPRQKDSPDLIFAGKYRPTAYGAHEEHTTQREFRRRLRALAVPTIRLGLRILYDPADYAAAMDRLKIDPNAKPPRRRLKKATI